MDEPPLSMDEIYTCVQIAEAGHWDSLELLSNLSEKHRRQVWSCLDVLTRSRLIDLKKSLQPPELISPHQIRHLMAVCKELGVNEDKLKTVLSVWGYSSRKHIEADYFDAVLADIKECFKARPGLDTYSPGHAKRTLTKTGIGID